MLEKEEFRLNILVIRTSKREHTENNYENTPGHAKRNVGTTTRVQIRGALRNSVGVGFADFYGRERKRRKQRWEE